MSYDGRLGFGLLGDYDALPDLEALADDLRRRDRRARAAPPAIGSQRRRGSASRPRPSAAARVCASMHRLRMTRSRSAQINATVGDIAGNAAQDPRAASRARARPGAELVALPRARDHRLPARGPAAQGALPRRRARARSSGSRPTRDGHRRASSASPSAPTTSTTRPPCSPTARVQAIYRKMLPAQLRRLRRAALLPARRRAARSSSVDGVTVGLTICEDIWVPGRAGDRRGAGRRATLIVNISASPYHARQGRRARADARPARARQPRARSPSATWSAARTSSSSTATRVVVDHDGDVIARAPQFAEELLVVRRRPRRPRRAARLRDTRHAAGGARRCAPRGRATLGALDRGAAGADAPRRRRRSPTLLDRRRRGLRGARARHCATTSSKNGFERVVLGLSGGIDSALVALHRRRRARARARDRA